MKLIRNEESFQVESFDDYGMDDFGDAFDDFDLGFDF